MTRAGGLLAAAAAAVLRRQGDSFTRRLVLPLRGPRALTADAAEAVQEEEQRQGEGGPLLHAADEEDSFPSAAHARRLREMEASTSMGARSWLPSAAEVASRLRSQQRSGSKGESIRSSLVLPASPDGSGGVDENENEVDQSPLPLRDWRDALEASKLLETQGDPLTDTFGRRHTYLRISLTERCNLRCTYCMPPDGVELTAKEELLTTLELQRLAGLFASLGVRKVRLTGGEPTLRPDLLELSRAISSQPGIDTVGITTNGLSLGAGGNPQKVDARLLALKGAGVTSLNVSLDTLRPERFEHLSRRPRAGHAAVLASIASASRLGFRDVVKVNVVVMKGVNDDEVPDFTRWALEAGLNVRFIEFMPFEANSWSTSKVVSYRDMLSAARKGVKDLGDLVPFEEEKEAGRGKMERRHYDGVAKDFVLSSSSLSSSPSSSSTSSPSAANRPGVVSFITSMTSPFCSSCTRLRLLADGNLKVCLLGGAEVSLRDAMRGGCSEPDLSLLIKGALANKKAAHAGMGQLAKKGKEVGAGRAMVRIGG